VYILWVETAMNLLLRQALQGSYQLRPLEPIPTYSLNQINTPVAVGSLVSLVDARTKPPE